MAEQAPSIKDLTEKAEEAEQNDDTATAIQLYEEILAKDPLDTYAYGRLMKIYRKLKEYKKELAIINTGIKAYEKFYSKRIKKPSKKVSELSAKLNRSFGLVDKKGNSAYTPEPLGGWKKRKETVSKKLKK